MSVVQGHRVVRPHSIQVAEARNEEFDPDDEPYDETDKPKPKPRRHVISSDAFKQK